MSDNISLLNAFNADQVIHNFEELTGGLVEPAERSAMRFVYHVFSEEIPFAISNKVERNKKIAEVALEKISFRYNLYKQYADFFPTNTCQMNMNALSIALICDEMIDYADKITERDEDLTVPTKFLSEKFFDEEDLEIAKKIWDDAQELEQLGMADDVEKPSLESIFLAHINAFEHIEDIKDSFNQKSDDMLRNFLNKDVPKIESIIYPHTLPGAHLKEAMTEITGIIYKKLGFTGNAANDRKKPYLMVVPTP